MGYYFVSEEEMLALADVVKEKTCRDTLPGNEMVDAIRSIGTSAFDAVITGQSDTLIDLDLTHVTTQLKGSMFQNNNAIRSVYMPNVTSIPGYCFNGCKNLESITIGADLTIGDYAFSGCSKLKHIAGDTSKIKSIGREAFSNCVELEGDLNLINLTSFGGTSAAVCNTFYNCEKLSSITIDYSQLGYTTVNETFGSCGADIIIKNAPNNLFNYTTTWYQPFCNWAGTKFKLNDLDWNTIPDTMNMSGYHWFNGAKNIEYINLPKTLTQIGQNSFYNCTSLKHIEVPDGVKYIYNSAFYGCSSLESIDLPDGLTAINQHAFRGCSSLTSLELPSNITSIGIGAFYGCTSLREFEIPINIKTIENDTFYGCSSLTNIVINEGIVTIGESAFYGCTSLENVDLPSSLTTLRTYAFRICTSLKTINIPSNVTTMGSGMFEGCKNVTTVILNNGVANTLQILGFSSGEAGLGSRVTRIYLLNPNVEYTFNTTSTSTIPYIRAWYMHNYIDEYKNGWARSDIQWYVPESKVSVYSNKAGCCLPQGNSNYNTSYNSAYISGSSDQVHPVSFDIVIDEDTYNEVGSVTWDSAKDEMNLAIVGNNVMNSAKTKYVYETLSESGSEYPVLPKDGIVFGRTYHWKNA